MKKKYLAWVPNFILCTVLLFVGMVGFVGGNISPTIAEQQTKVYYGSDGESDGSVCLMFNVYQNEHEVEQILSILKQNDAKSTFFLGGCWADDRIDLVRKIQACGHEIATHGYFHKDHSKMSYAENLDEIRPSITLLNKICGIQVKLFAPPSGAFNAQTVQAASDLGLKTIMWSRDTIDWRDQDPNLIFLRATQNLKQGEFILMHPTAATVEALPKILEYISKNGLKTTTVSCCIGE